MAYIELNKAKFEHNFRFLDTLFKQNNIQWGVVSKLLCGNKSYLKMLINLGIKEIHDSRISNLKAVKSIAADVQTVYIKPPPQRSLKSLIQYADVSLNTELDTIRKISEEALRQKKLHKIIIMVELGDLREGILGENLIEFYSRVFELPNIEVIGLGTNLNCMNGIMPSYDKLIQLSLYKQLIEAKFNKIIPWISGGSSVTIPLIFKHMLPKDINHFRVGETLFFGNNLINKKPIKGMMGNVFSFFAEIIELSEKNKIPIGMKGTNVAGEIIQINEQDFGKKSYRAILDIGLLDINMNNLILKRKNYQFSGASSDMIVLDIGRNSGNLKTGDLIEFGLDYMGVLRIISSEYIEKRIK